MGRTNIVLDDELLQEGMHLSGAHSMRELVDEALKAYVQQMRRRRIRELRGTIVYEEGYDYRALRDRVGG